MKKLKSLRSVFSVETSPYFKRNAVLANDQVNEAPGGLMLVS